MTMIRPYYLVSAFVVAFLMACAWAGSVETQPAKEDIPMGVVTETKSDNVVVSDERKVKVANKGRCVLRIPGDIIARLGRECRGMSDVWV